MNKQLATLICYYDENLGNIMEMNIYREERSEQNFIKLGETKRMSVYKWNETIKRKC